MRDGQTRQLETDPSAGADLFASFAANWRVSLVILSGSAEGSEWEIDRREATVGRGNDNTIVIDDSSISKQHVAFEFSDSGYRVRDLGSSNGTLLNGSEIRVAELKHGDRIQLGEHTLQLILERRNASPRTYVIPDGDQ